MCDIFCLFPKHLRSFRELLEPFQELESNTEFINIFVLLFRRVENSLVQTEQANNSLGIFIFFCYKNKISFFLNVFGTFLGNFSAIRNNPKRILRMISGFWEFQKPRENNSKSDFKKHCFGGNFGTFFSKSRNFLKIIKKYKIFAKNTSFFVSVLAPFGTIFGDKKRWIY